MQSVYVERDATKLQRQVPQEQERADRIPLLAGGMRTDRAPQDLAPQEAVLMQGVHIVAGRLVVDTGYVPWGGSYDGIAQAFYEAFFNDSTTATLLVTTTTVYVWVPGVAQWQVVSQDMLYEVDNGPYLAGATVIDLVDITDLVAGDTVGILNDDGTQYITEVLAVGASDITVAPLPKGVDDSATVSRAPALEGDPTISQVVIQIFAANDWVVISNGIDEVSYYVGGVYTKVPGLPTNTTCRAIAVFHECLFLGNLVENGTRMSHRVRMSDLGDPTEWTPGVGIAAIYDLLDTEDDIQALKTLGPWLICYRYASIMKGSYIGAPNEIIFWEYMVQGEGVVSQGAICDTSSKHSGQHLVVCTTGVFGYAGGYNLDPIGEQIFNNFLGANGDLNAGAQGTLFTIFVPNLDEVWILYPADRSDVPDKMLRWNASFKCWFQRDFADDVVAAAPYLVTSFTSWAQAVGTWEDVMWARPWDSRSLAPNVAPILLCPAVDGSTPQQLLLYDYRAATDDGATISWNIVTRMWGDGAEFRRWESVTLTATGQVLVEYSQDEEDQAELVTWTPLRTAEFGSTASVERIYIDHVSTRIQFKLSGTDAAFAFRNGTLRSLAETEW